MFRNKHLAMMTFLFVCGFSFASMADQISSRPCIAHTDGYLKSWGTIPASLDTDVLDQKNQTMAYRGDMWEHAEPTKSGIINADLGLIIRGFATSEVPRGECKYFIIEDQKEETLHDPKYNTVAKRGMWSTTYEIPLVQADKKNMCAGEKYAFDTIGKASQDSKFVATSLAPSCAIEYSIDESSTYMKLSVGDKLISLTTFSSFGRFIGALGPLHDPEYGLNMYIGAAARAFNKYFIASGKCSRLEVITK